MAPGNDQRDTTNHHHRTLLRGAARVALPLILALPAFGGGEVGLAGPGEPAAPDGRRGLGWRTEGAELLAVFRRPEAEDEVFLEHLAGLESELTERLGRLGAAYDARGLLALAGDGEQPAGSVGVGEFHGVFRLALQDPESWLRHPDPAVAAAFAEAFLDTRLRARADLLLGWEEDAREVRDGLAVLRAMTDGWVHLEEETLQDIAARVDLAASLLRARIRDLDALHQTDGASEIDPRDVAELDAFAADVDAGGDGRAAERLLGTVALREAEETERMLSLCFTTRAQEEMEPWLRWRDAGRAAAEGARREVERVRPDPEETEAPRGLETATATQRRRLALDAARAGLAHDPLDAWLAYEAGVLCGFVSGELESFSHYDRFLALRGIRSHRWDSYGKRELTEEERRALFFVQQATFSDR